MSQLDSTFPHFTLPFYFDLYLTPLFILNALLILFQSTKHNPNHCTGYFPGFPQYINKYTNTKYKTLMTFVFLVVVFTSKITMTQGTWSFAPSFLVFSLCIKPNTKKRQLAHMPCPSCAEFFMQVFPSTEVKSHTNYNINQNVLRGLITTTKCFSHNQMPWHHTNLNQVDD